MTSDQPIPIRPRSRQPKPEANGEAPAIPRDDPVRQLTHALEDLHAAARANRLPPMRVVWDAPDEEVDWRDAEQRALQVHVSTFLADHEGLRQGPIAWPLPEIQPPENPDSFLVTNLIRPGTTVMLAGPPGAAKSWAARQLALTAGAGLETFLDRYEISRPMSVLVVDEDNGPDEEWRRDERLLTHLGLQRDQVKNVRRVSLEGVMLDQERWQRWLRGAIRLYECDLVILDPISEMHGGKELREDPAFRSLLAFVKRLKVDFPQMATVLVHHTRKLPASERQSHRGLEDVRGQWGQTPDVVVLMSPMGERRSKWEVHKRVAHSSLILEQVAQGHLGEGGLKFTQDESVQKAKAMANDDAVIDAIRGGLTTFADIQHGIGMAKSTLVGVLKRLVRSGTVKKHGTTYSADPDDG